MLLENYRIHKCDGCKKKLSRYEIAYENNQGITFCDECAKEKNLPIKIYR